MRSIAIALRSESKLSQHLAQLLKRAGEKVNRKHVQRIMREDNSLCLHGNSDGI